MNKKASSWFRCCTFSALMLMLASCSSPLPKGENITKSPWDSFNQAKLSYDEIICHKTTTLELQKLGFDPYNTPNVRILSYLDIIQKFNPNNSVKAEDLPPSVRTCIEAREACLAYEATPGVRHSKRTGNVVLDLLKFKRTRIETGWQFNALIVIDHGIIVYKIWSGTPIIDKEESKKNPLGLFQDSIDTPLKNAVGM